jgi:hypothetical protein
MINWDIFLHGLRYKNWANLGENFRFQYERNNEKYQVGNMLGPETFPGKI